ncbi:hypothetical protein BCR32DRAFT_283344 [Anaeromyces robustus]|uniref:Uncharacterized protein n=1 Tax=Anaeromyces robustus TaxID=1754192 RepID=A0A1Y1WUP9_9FUNG|nr:hypothetical protein BCR32DRAFT_283344 [Anaeromyces robustus]|eukprot:ORX77270.1 hypothetical protein BCR32DRAFT_283344 [Anaeromyces robustus]
MIIFYDCQLLENAFNTLKGNDKDDIFNDENSIFINELANLEKLHSLLNNHNIYDDNKNKLIQNFNNTMVNFTIDISEFEKKFKNSYDDLLNIGMNIKIIEKYISSLLINNYDYNDGDIIVDDTTSIALLFSQIKTVNKLLMGGKLSKFDVLFYKYILSIYNSHGMTTNPEDVLIFLNKNQILYSNKILLYIKRCSVYIKKNYDNDKNNNILEEKDVCMFGSKNINEIKLKLEDEINNNNSRSFFEDILLISKIEFNNPNISFNYKLNNHNIYYDYKNKLIQNFNNTMVNFTIDISEFESIKYIIYSEILKYDDDMTLIKFSKYFKNVYKKIGTIFIQNKYISSLLINNYDYNGRDTIVDDTTSIALLFSQIKTVNKLLMGGKLSKFDVLFYKYILSIFNSHEMTTNPKDVLIFLNKNQIHKSKNYEFGSKDINEIKLKLEEETYKDNCINIFDYLKVIEGDIEFLKILTKKLEDEASSMDLKKQISYMLYESINNITQLKVKHQSRYSYMNMDECGLQRRRT